jgi:LmbE family N-acetylglucosaminyl deacetylase
MIRIFYIILCLFVQSQSWSQQPEKLNSAEIFHEIQKLQFLGSALYVAAHPDDENTRLIAYLANELKANTAYLSLTRGGGGQNLIGTELADQLGVLRTQELLAARRTDGGQQLFSRAIDFGYSKHPDETLSIWNKDKVLSDVVWAMRKHKPDIIVNRFDHRTPGRTHGHHTSSAMLSVEAFDIVNKKSTFPDQLDYVEPWQPKRLFFNTSWWFYGSRDKFAEADKTNLMSLDVGTYYPVLGKSNNEIAAASRSMHKCQGFGSTGTRGSELEYLEIIKGDMPADKQDLFAGINTTWTRVEGGGDIGTHLKKIEQEFNLANPAASVSDLMVVRDMISNLDDGHWRSIKLADLDNVLKACLGLYTEVKTEDQSAIPGQTIDIQIEALNRSAVPVHFNSLTFSSTMGDTIINTPLANNEGLKLFKQIKIPHDAELSSPYWLKEKSSLGIYTVEDRSLIGLPENPPALQATFDLSVNDKSFPVTVPVVFKKNDPVDGEVYQPFNIVPEASVSLSDKVYIFNSSEPKTIKVSVKAHKDNLEGKLELCHPSDWKVYPESVDISLVNKGMDQTFDFTLTPPDTQSVQFIVPLLKVGENSYTNDLLVVDYNHIPMQASIKDASARVVRLEIEKKGQRVGYIMGAGDEVHTGLKQIGYDVDLITPQQISLELLNKYDAVVTGIRAYNTLDDLKFKQDILLEYVENGGNLIIQYNTSRRFSLPNIGPYPLKLSRDRVTDETAEIRFLAKDHPVLNTPNKITESDFENWVQERGLYFPGEWDDAYTPIFSMNDKGEDEKHGSMLVAEYGKGNYIYTGISFFREIPFGVPGAYRLLANMISLDKNVRP